jgi:hypothetical protein
MPENLTQPKRPFDPPDKIEPDKGTVPEVPQMFAPGEMAPAEGMKAFYGYRNERLPKHYQDVLRTLCQKIAERDLFARIDEILRAAEQRFYWRSMFDIYFNEQNYVWELPNGVANRGGGETGDQRLSYAFNIYQAKGRGFISQVGQTPNIRFKPCDSNAPNALKTASGANAFKSKIESVNDIGQLAKEVARLMWTDGRVCLYSRWVTDGALFGYQDENTIEEVPEGLGEGGDPPPKTPRRPKGGEKIDAYGVLETRVPITMRKISDFPFIQLAYEIDLTTAKSMYPHISDSISGSTPGPGEYEFDTVTRVAINQGLRLLTQTGDTVHQIPTWQRTWMRPAMYAEIEDSDDRLFFERNFPDGCKVGFVGDTYAESTNESMDDHWRVMYPIEGDGQQTPSCGYVMMSVQDALNDLTDLQMETFMKAIPAIYGNKAIVDFPALSKQKAGPGAHYPTKRDLAPEEDLTKQFWAEPDIKFPAEAMTFYGQLWSDIPDNLTGLTQVNLGLGDPSNETKGGILALQDASKGFQGPAWRSWQSAYARSLEQAVRIGAYYRAAEAEEGKLHMEIPGGQSIEIDLEDLRPGSYYAEPESDQNLPQTFEDGQRMFGALVQSAMTGFQPAVDTLAEPQNRIQMKKYMLPPGCVAPGSDEVEDEMSVIQQLLQESPLPNLQAMQMYQQTAIQALAAGAQPPPEQPPEQMLQPSVPPDPPMENSQLRSLTGKAWINSPEGKQAKRDNPQGYMNVRLRVLAHDAAVKSNQMEQAKLSVLAEGAKEAAKAHGKASAERPKSPSETINYKDAGPTVKLQMEAQAGLDGTADAALNTAKALQPPKQPNAPPVQ